MPKPTSLAMRLSLVITALTLTTALFMTGFYVYTGTLHNQREIEDYRQELAAELTSRLEMESVRALKPLEAFYAMQTAGEITEEMAHYHGARAIEGMNHDNMAYWLVNEAGEEVTSPPAWTAKGNLQTVTSHFAPYGWTVKVAVDTAKGESLVSAWEEELTERLKQNLWQLAGGLTLLELLCIAAAMYTGAGFARPINALTKCLAVMGDTERLKDEEVLEQLEAIKERRDEIGRMHQALKDMHLKMAEYRQTILDMARKDSLTGLANRRYFQEYASNLGSRKGAVVIALDLDNFKEVNDAYGHQTGDAALLIFAEVMKSVFTDALNVRMGGDEFLSFMTHQESLEAVEEKLARFMTQLTSIYQSDPDLSLLTVSAGVAASFAEEVPLEILVQHGDVALYAAKAAGRSCYIVYKPEQLATAY